MNPQAQNQPETTPGDKVSDRARPAPPLPPPVPDYELLRRIGGGAYGEVWLGRSTATGVLRAVKIVYRRTFDDERPYEREFEGIQRFERLSREHPGQLALFHVGRNAAARCFYYVMELADAVENPKPEIRNPKEIRMSNAEAPTAEQEVRASFGFRHSTLYAPHTLRAQLQQGRIPAARVLEIGLVLTEALAHLHSHGLVHRDVKPSNVIFVNGRPKLADIGLVTDAGDTRSIVGTEGYLAPEGPGTPQADILALGKVLYESATGVDRRQFPHLPSDLRAWPDAKLVFELNEVLLKACAKEVSDRYSTAEEMHADLALLQRGQSVKRRRAVQRRSALAKRFTVTAMWVTLSAVGGYLLVATMSSRTRRAQQLSLVELAGTKSVEAYKKYEQGRTARRQGNAQGLKEALKLMREAVLLDPTFLSAWEELFSSYIESGGEDAKSQQRVIAKKLDQLNPNSAEAHAARAWIAYQDFEFARADNEFQLAIRSDPSKPRPHRRYGNFLLECGRLQQARREFGDCETLEPGFARTQNWLGDCFFVERKYAQALTQYERSLRLAQQEQGTYWRLGRLYEADHQILKAIDAFQRARTLNGEEPEKIAQRYDALRQAFREKEEPGYWSKRLEQAAAELSPEIEPYLFASFHARLGHTEQALTLPEKGWKVRDIGLQSLIVDQQWDELRGNERFKNLLKAIGYRTDWPVR